MTVTAVHIRQILPQCRDTGLWAYELQKVLPEYGIDTPAREAAFLAQVGHESAHLTRLVEGLSYSVRGLRTTWPGRFPDDASAAPYARNPQRLANFVYADRLGNGSFESGDGWKYRGRGLIQITGKANYAELAQATGIKYTQHPELLERPADAARSAAWFWQSRGLNELADKDRFAAITKKINGGTTGQEDRLRLWWLAREVLGVQEKAA